MLVEVEASGQGLTNLMLCTSENEAYLRHLMPFPAREGGHLITTQGVGKLIASLDFMLRVALIPRGLINHGRDGGDKF